MSDMTQQPLPLPVDPAPPVDRPRHPHAYDDGSDEMDRFALLCRLWGSKWLILLVTLVTTLIVDTYALTATAPWTVRAYVAPPQLAQLEDYLARRQAVDRVSGINADPQAIANHLFSQFTQRMASPNEKRAYLSTTDYANQQTEGMDPQAREAWLTEMADNGLVVSPPDEKNTLPYFTLSVSADNPQAALALLTDYVDRINDKVMAKDEAEFRHHVEAMILARQKAQQDINNSLQTNRDNQWGDLARPSTTVPLIGGENDSANSVGQRETGRVLNLLEQLGQQPVTAQGYRYEMSPDEDVKKDRPSKALILGLGALLGSILGLGLALALDSVTRYRRD
ncbi:Wzz/FepE/Etk N-terminal domain-containing protein [Budvicia aquatica]|nr:Wzz/FepE/Etk N-terminal domain-containing protein [Budvicia aquatica]